MKHAFDIYSEQTLSFKLAGQKKSEDFLVDCDIELLAKKCLSFAKKANALALIIFGAGDGSLAEKIAILKPQELRLIVCDLYPEEIQNIQKRKKFLDTTDNTHLIADTSIWAHFLLLLQYGFTSATSHLVLNPCIQGDSKKNHQNLQKLFSGCKNVLLPESKDNGIKISAGAILSPDEPDLDSFISSFPAWLEELVLVWDCSDDKEIPLISCDTGLKIVNICHRLNNDFGAQRNIMLDSCKGDWIIYLDADERFPEKQWEQLKKIASYKDCDGWYFPRMTLYPDADHCRMGYGLWPDLQLRFFRKSAKTKFLNKIHERLAGLEGQTGLLAEAPIKHITHLLKNRTEIEAKLASFNKATAGRFNHKLGSELPRVETSLLETKKNIPLPPVILPKIIF
ncbi:glycosyltransferase [Maridesulfovibrio frigidus]|uniref:glycosyltransferase n=1 Tax=Maridesulfovibrio frigidus TaxID=340956 RepID=UPI0004E1E998|nr:glycosyltransferase [Maridesulfovibrio frigidus]